jgi:hypothetical protein
VRTHDSQSIGAWSRPVVPCFACFLGLLCLFSGPLGCFSALLFVCFLMKAPRSCCVNALLIFVLLRAFGTCCDVWGDYVWFGLVAAFCACFLPVFGGFCWGLAAWFGVFACPEMYSLHVFHAVGINSIPLMCMPRSYFSSFLLPTECSIRVMREADHAKKKKSQ